MFFKLFSRVAHRKQSSPSRLYFDFASSTPLDTAVLDTVPVIPSDVLAANPSSLHREGVALKKYLSDARVRCARALGCQSDEIIFTSGATESNNLALLGTVGGWIEKGIQPSAIALYTSSMEHATVIESTQYLQQQGVRLCEIATTKGVVIPESIDLPSDCVAVFISVQYIHNEIGTVQPIKSIAKRVRYLRKHHPHVRFVVHVDATQAPLFFSLTTAALGVDLLTLGATKLYTHKGVGLLYRHRNITLKPLMYGGGQEQGVRPGTEPVALIHVFSHALAYAALHTLSAGDTIRALQTYFEQGVVRALPDVVITAQESERAPHISHIMVPFIESELLVLELDARGIAVSAKSACKNEDGGESTIVSLFYPRDEVRGALRFSFGRSTTTQHIDMAIKALVSVVQKYRTS